MTDHHDERDDRDDRDEDERASALPPRAPGEGVRIIGAEEAASKMEAGEAAGRRPPDAPRFGEPPPAPQGPRPAHRFPLPDSEPPRAGAGRPADLPHWTEPPTGEVPRILPESEDDDLEAWSALRRAPRWRDSAQDWADEDDALLGDDEDEEDLRVGARQPQPTPWDFDEPDAEPDLTGTVGAAGAPRATRTTRIASRPEPLEPPATARRSTDRDLPVAVATGVGFAAVAIVCFLLGPAWSAALATGVVLLAAVEVFDVFRRAGYRTATLLGLVATGSLMVAAYLRGERAVPLVLALTVVFSMLWYLGGVVRARPTVNLGMTLLAVGWVGFLGSFATLMLRYPNREGIAFLLATVLVVVANDVGALFAGRRFGNTPLAPEISPNKTVEGYLGGLVLALLVAAVIVTRIHPWSLGSALALGVVASIVGPVGDLCESMIKRDLGVKDMGSILPGHGGVLDRFDAILFTLPAAYYLVELLEVATA